MPELPEVETIKLGLERYLIGHKILDVEVRKARIFSGDAEKIKGATVKGVRRFGKGLLIDLDNDYSLAIHVKMTGQVLYRNSARGPAAPNPTPMSSFHSGHSSGVPSRVTPRKVDVSQLPDVYTHVIFKLNNDAYLFYRDVRQFGWVKIVKTIDASDLPFFKSLGPEPFKDLDLKKFKEILTRNKAPIKLVIMDQIKMAGIGNIYANDALYVAKIHPKRPANSLTKKEQEALFKAIEKVLRKGIEAGGASEWNYVDALGGAGQYQNFFQVYNKKGKPCKNCGAIIEKIVLGGRGTFFCPPCQH